MPCVIRFHRATHILGIAFLVGEIHLITCSPRLERQKHKGRCGGSISEPESGEVEADLNDIRCGLFRVRIGVRVDLLIIMLPVIVEDAANLEAGCFLDDKAEFDVVLLRSGTSAGGREMSVGDNTPVLRCCATIRAPHSPQYT